MNTGWVDSTAVFDVVVAGGGLSGLAVAEAILRRAPAAAFEPSDAMGS